MTLKKFLHFLFLLSLYVEQAELLRAVDGCQLKYKSCRDDRNTLGRSKDSPQMIKNSPGVILKIKLTASC